MIITHDGHISDDTVKETVEIMPFGATNHRI
jgi:hypothetical protein